jgi:hypothetical protein
MEFEELKEAELGQTFDLEKLQGRCKSIYIASSWPDKRPGFVVAVASASGKDEVCPRDEIYLLDEFESWSLREVVMQCGVFNLKYRPKRWVCDWKNSAAARFINEVGSSHPSEPFELLEMKPLYPYILDEIRRLLTPDRRLLFLPDNSKIRGYLGEIEPGEIAELELGAYPAIEALAFAIIEMRQDARNITVHKPIRSPWDNNILLRGLNAGKKMRRRRG